MPAWTVENPDKVKEADLIIGIPSRNEADSIGFAVEQASEGLAKYFANLRAVIVNCDNQSDDGTKEAFFAARSKVPRIYLSTPDGVRGKGNNLKNLFRLAGELKTKAVVCLDADTKSLSPKWIKTSPNRSWPTTHLSPPSTSPTNTTARSPTPSPIPSAAVSTGAGYASR
ncbi:hypothetical protein FDZ71_07170 [bacterium]|nr:MAG: hypothetical protein FDZ71_07170 [bacterium]